MSVFWNQKFLTINFTLEEEIKLQLPFLGMLVNIKVKILIFYVLSKTNNINQYNNTIHSQFPLFDSSAQN